VFGYAAACEVFVHAARTAPRDLVILVVAHLEFFLGVYNHNCQLALLRKHVVHDEFEYLLLVLLLGGPGHFEHFLVLDVPHALLLLAEEFAQYGAAHVSLLTVHLLLDQRILLYHLLDVHFVQDGVFQGGQLLRVVFSHDHSINAVSVFPFDFAPIFVKD